MTEQNLPPTTADERAAVRIRALHDYMVGSRNSVINTNLLRRLCHDIDRLTAERDGLQARLTASEAGAAAMREALEQVARLLEALRVDGGVGHILTPGEKDNYRAIHAQVNAALANPAGAALLEERKRVRRLPDAWERNGWVNVTSQDSGLSGYSEGLLTCAAGLRAVLTEPVNPRLSKESHQVVEILRECVGWMDNLRLGTDVGRKLTVEGRAEFMAVLERARALSAALDLHTPEEGGSGD